MPYFTVTTNKM